MNNILEGIERELYINLHCHSRYSDSRASLFALAEKHKELGFCAFVITDHFEYLSKEIYINQTRELEKISCDLDYPCIQGIELDLYNEEILVFGQEAIYAIFEYVEDNKKAFTNEDVSPESRFKEATKLLEMISGYKENSGIILPHPRLVEKDSTKGKEFYGTLFEVIDGYERFNMGRDWFLRREVPKELLNKKAFKNSDAHDIDYVDRGNNPISQPITNEEQVIAFIKGKIL